MAQKYSRGSARFSGSYNYHSPVQARRLPVTRRSTRHRKTPLVIVAGLLLLFGAHTLSSHHAAAHDLSVAPAQAQQVTLQHQRLVALDNQLRQLIADNPQLDISISVGPANSTGGLQHYGVADSFDAASTAKLLTAADYLHHVERGQASLTQTIQGEKASQWLQAMIVHSDDTAWAALNDYLTHNDLANYAVSVGFTQYNVADNLLPSSDIAGLLQKLYSHKLLNTANTALLLGNMKQANFRDYIVHAVPSDYAVYHKVGINNDDVHDAAIISHDSQAIVLVIYTNGHGTYNWDNRAQLMQTITSDAVKAYLP